MKTPKEIEKLAKKSILSKQGQVGFTLGYNACLKDLFDRNNNESLKISEWQLCPKCLGEGQVENRGTSTSVYRVCPVCNGNKTLIKPCLEFNSDESVKFANFIRNEINEDRLRHYDPMENGKWAYWERFGGGIAKQLTTNELYDIFIKSKNNQ